MSRLDNALRHAYEVLAAAAIAVAVTYYAAGCAGAKEAVAEATYLGQQLECVDHLQTKADIDGCRASVRRRWGIVETVTKDAGGER